MFNPYPEFVIYIVLGIGIPLAMTRPYKAFLLAVFLLTAGNSANFTFTRTAWLGPYLNLSDACELIALAALFFHSLGKKMPLRVSMITFLLFAVLAIAACQSFCRLGWTYETARAFRWGLQMPIAFLIGANMVTSSAKTKQLIGVLLCGTILAAMQHIFWTSSVWSSRSVDMQTYELARTISYKCASFPAAFLLTGLIWKMPRNTQSVIIYIFSGTLFIVTLILGQSRSVWLATGAAIPCLLVLFKKKNLLVNIMRFGIVIALLFIAAQLFSRHLVPGLDISRIFTDRLSSFSQNDSVARKTITREKAFKTEMNYWLDGTLILGRGLYFFQDIENPEEFERHIAFAHLGYVTYLSQMGLVGLFVYGFYFPLSIIRDGKLLWQYSKQPTLCYTGLLGICSIVCLSIQFLASSHFLSLGYFIPGVLYGSLWYLARAQKRGSTDSEIKKCLNQCNSTRG